MLTKLNNDLNIDYPRAVLFDTDNTLYEYAPANNAAIEAVYLKANNLLGLKRNTFFNLYNKARLQIKKDLNKTASSHSRLLYFQRMIELLGYNAKLLLALDFEQTFWRTFLSNAPLFPNVYKFLNLLKESDIPIGVITDLTAQIQLRKLTYFGLEDTFDAIVTSEEVGADKPDPKNFTLMLSKLKLSSMTNIWMIGDNPTSDILGSKKLGATTFQKIHRGIKIGEGEKSPDVIFSSYKDLETFTRVIISN